MDESEAFKRGLDLHQPDWWFRYATMTELQDFAATIAARNNIEVARNALRRDVANRLTMPVRAAIDAGIVKLPQ